MAEQICECGHEKKWHGIPEHHNLRTSHCTVLSCDCKEFKENPTATAEVEAPKPQKKQKKSEV